MMLEGHRLLAQMKTKAEYPEQLAQSYKFLFDYIYNDLSVKELIGKDSTGKSLKKYLNIEESKVI